VYQAAQDWSMVKKGGVATFSLFPANRKQGPAARTNNKQENVNQIQANNVMKRSEVRKNRKEIQKYFSIAGASEKNLKPCLTLFRF
jgi:hypothetical protein